MSFMTTFVIVSWYVVNIAVLLGNKYLLSSYRFNHPLFLTLCHMVACTAFSALCAAVGLVPRRSIQSRSQAWKICVLGAVFCLTIVLGNISLKYIPVSFTQAIGATTPAFTAVLAWLMTNKPETKEVYLTLVPVVLGIVIASGGEPSFHMLGFIYAVAATAGRAFKSVLQGLMLSDQSEKMDSMNMLMYMSPVAVVLLLPLTYALESNAITRAYELAALNPGFFPMLLINSFLAFLVNLLNFLVTRYTSALTLQVLGNAKGVLAAIVSVYIFRNPVTAMGIVGYVVTMFGVALYSSAKRRLKAMEEKRLDAIVEFDSEMLNSKSRLGNSTGANGQA